MAQKYTKTKLALFDYVANVMIPRIQTLMRVEGLVASEKTSQSLKATNSSGLAVRIRSRQKRGYEILQIINRGAKEFKQTPPSKAIMTWMDSKNIKPRDTKTGKFVKANEKNKRRSAFLIARSIKNKGLIKRFNYGGAEIVEKSFQYTEKKFDKIVIDVLAKEMADRISEGKQI